MDWLEMVMWVVMASSLFGTVINVKADDPRRPCVFLKTVSFSIWIATNAAWVIYDIHKMAYPQAAMMACYLFTAAWGLWKFRFREDMATD